MKLILALIAALLAACEPAKPRIPESAEHKRNGYEVETLFTHDSCTVYRFYDDGRNRYFTNCSGSTSWQESCGKSCTFERSVQGGRK